MDVDAAAPTTPAPAATALRDCANCGTARAGPWCHLCGQHEDQLHHSVKRLALETVEHLTNADGRVLKTLKGLVFRPAALTKSYLAGKRASQVSPLQLFFLTLVLFLFVAEHKIDVRFETPTPDQIALMPSYIRWIMPISDRIHQHGGDFLALMRQSAEIFGLLTVPVAAMLLWILYAAYPSRLYDHLIFSLHSLSFQFAGLCIVLFLPDAVGYLSVPIMGLMVTHLYMHMRGVYGSTRLGTVLRALALGASTFFAYTALSVAWVAWAYFEMTEQ